MTGILGHIGLGGLSVGRLLSTGLIFGVSVATAVTAATGAIFSDTQSVGANTFSTGTVSISSSPASAAISLSGMAPGDSVTSPITVTNDGSLELRYAVQSTTTENTLAAQLDMTIWDEAEEGDGGTTCNSTPPVTKLYGPADLGNTVAVNVVGDPAQGSQSGDRVVAASANEVLCIQVSLPLASGNSFQNVTTTATLDFIGEQTANN